MLQQIQYFNILQAVVICIKHKRIVYFGISKYFIYVALIREVVERVFIGNIANV